MKILLTGGGEESLWRKYIESVLPEAEFITDPQDDSCKYYIYVVSPKYSYESFENELLTRCKTNPDKTILLNLTVEDGLSYTSEETKKIIELSQKVTDYSARVFNKISHLFSQTSLVFGE